MALSAALSGFPAVFSFGYRVFTLQWVHRAGGDREEPRVPRAKLCKPRGLLILPCVQSGFLRKAPLTVPVKGHPWDSLRVGAASS